MFEVEFFVNNSFHFSLFQFDNTMNIIINQVIFTDNHTIFKNLTFILFNSNILYHWTKEECRRQLMCLRIYHRQNNKCYPKSVYLPISKLQSILLVVNLLAHNNISQICYCGQISLQSAAVNCSFSGNVPPLGVTFLLLAVVHWYPLSSSFLWFEWEGFHCSLERPVISTVLPNRLLIISRLSLLVVLYHWKNDE